MKGLITGIFMAVFLGTFTESSAQDAPKKSAKEMVDEGLATAKKESKNVFLVIGGLGCNYTVFLDKYHKDPAVRKILEPHYVFVRIEWYKEPGGKELWESYANGKMRLPIWVILDPAGKILGISGLQEEAGYPISAKDFDHYSKALTIGSPKLTRADINILHQKLIHHWKF